MNTRIITDTAYTFKMGDVGEYLEFTNASPITATVPGDAAGSTPRPDTQDWSDGEVLTFHSGRRRSADDRSRPRRDDQNAGDVGPRQAVCLGVACLSRQRSLGPRRLHDPCLRRNLPRKMGRRGYGSANKAYVGDRCWGGRYLRPAHLCEARACALTQRQPGSLDGQPDRFLKSSGSSL